MSFLDHCLHTTSAAAGDVPIPVAPWKPAVITHGMIHTTTPRAEIRDLALRCRYGGKLVITSHNQGWAKNFVAGDKIPPGTVLSADFEHEDTDPANQFPERLCEAIASVTDNYICYPSHVGESAEPAIEPVARMWTSDMANLAQGHVNRMRFVRLLGRYAFVGCYIFSTDEPSIDLMFRAWMHALAYMRANFKDKIILAQVWNEYQPNKDPNKGPIIPEGLQLKNAHMKRIARFAANYFDGVWVWGPRKPNVVLMQQIVAVARNPLMDDWSDQRVGI